MSLYNSMTAQTITTQFVEMVNAGRMPILEMELGNDEFLLVDLSIDVNVGMIFSFDTNDMPVSFDGDIIELSKNQFALPFDEYTTKHGMLEMIYDNVQDGFISYNNLQNN